MRILIISDLYPYSSTPEHTDAVMLLHYYARIWNQTNHVEVIFPHSYNLLSIGVHKNLEREVKLDGISIHNRTILRLPGGMLWTRSFLNVVDVSSFEIILACMPVSLEVAYYLSNKSNVPYLAYLQGTDFRRSGAHKGQFSSKYKKWLGNARQLVCVSELLHRRFSKVLPAGVQSSVIPGAVFDHWVQGVSARWFDFSTKMKLLTVARLVRQKRLNVILEMLAHSELNCDYKIVGDGEDAEEIKGIVRSSDRLRQIVEFKGWQPREVVKATLDRSEIMILLSTNESFGLVYLEAMARGCIVIATRNDGIDGTIIHGENGFLCESDPVALGKLLNEIVSMSSENLQLISDKAITTAKRHTYSYLSEKFLRIIQNCSKGGY